MKYNDRIRDLRMDADMSQDKVAKMLGVGQRTYSDYESGKTRIPVERLILLAEYYDVDMDYICGVTEKRDHFPR